MRLPMRGNTGIMSICPARHCRLVLGDDLLPLRRIYTNGVPGEAGDEEGRDNPSKDVLKKVMQSRLFPASYMKILVPYSCMEVTGCDRLIGCKVVRVFKYVCVFMYFDVFLCIIFYSVTCFVIALLLFFYFYFILNNTF